MNIAITVLAVIVFLFVVYQLINSSYESFTSEESETIEEATTATIVPSSLTLNSSESSDTSASSSYYEYPETFVENKGGLDMSALYKDYEGPLKSKKQWTNMTLAQCHDACNNMSGCVGFSRVNSDPESEATCLPRTRITQCHSIRKGNPSQRTLASGYKTYIKTQIPHQQTKCIGAEKLTLNRMISIKSDAKPFHYISLVDNSVIMKEFKTTGVDFANQCKFYIVKGFENSNTVSFRMSDSNDIHYYIVNDGTGQLGVVPIDESKTTLDIRTRASFELFDGLSNEYMVSIRSIGVACAKPLYLSIADMSVATPRIKLISLDDANSSNKSKKAATFDIVDYVSGISILVSAEAEETKEDYADMSGALGSSFNPNRKSKFNKSMLTSTGYKDDFYDIPNARRVLKATVKNTQAYEDDPYYKDLKNYDANAAISNTNQLIDEKVLIDKSDNELKLWREGVSKYNSYIDNKQQDIQARLQKLANISNNVQIQDLAREYYFLKQKVNDAK
jgi:hypothetical protein